MAADRQYAVQPSPELVPPGRCLSAKLPVVRVSRAAADRPRQKILRPRRVVADLFSLVPARIEAHLLAAEAAALERVGRVAPEGRVLGPQGGLVERARQVVDRAWGAEPWPVATARLHRALVRQIVSKGVVLVGAGVCYRHRPRGQPLNNHDNIINHQTNEGHRPARDS
eukprot:506651-Prymnesium_polylepis.1